MAVSTQACKRSRTGDPSRAWPGCRRSHGRRWPDARVCPLEYPWFGGVERHDMSHSKKIGFLSFGAWHPGGGLTRSAGDALQQTVELAVAAEEIGIDGAFVRVHHFARQLASPFPLLAAIGVKTGRMESGTGGTDGRYENPLSMAETAAAADLLAGGRLQLGISRGSPEPAWRGAEAFGYSLDADEARGEGDLFR